MSGDKEYLELSGKITSLILYKNFIQKLNKWYKKHGNKNVPTLDLSGIEGIDALCLPNLLSIATIIKSFHKESLNIILPYDYRVVNFLNNSEFLLTGELEYLNLFKYNHEMVSKASFFIDTENRKEHKVHHYMPDMKYYKLTDIDEQLSYRTLMYENIRYIVVPDNYKKVIEDKNILTDNEVDDLLDIIAEIICNSVLYSKSISYAFVQTDRFKSCFSISDVGIGFKNALKNKKNFDYYIQRKYKQHIKDDKFEDLLYIIEILNYSMNQNRRNLWSLKNLIVNNGGILRIHNNSTQVVFTANRCSGCTKRAEECLLCLKESYDNGLSNLRIFEGRLRGVHIEVELRNEGRR